MDDKIEADCPDCRSQVRFTLEDASRQRTVRCSRGHRVKIQDEGGNARRASQVQRDLDRALKRFGS